MQIPPLQRLGSLEERAVMEDRIKGVADGAPLKILEAGCGHKWQFKLDGVNFELTGIDLDADALEIRKNKVGDLHQAIVGDLRTADLGESQFDVIYSSFVLEHVPQADRVMENFVRWLRPGGIIVLRIPDPDSAQGFITRITPHWFHVWYYRQIIGNKNAGKPGHGPYETFFHPVVSRRGMREFCAGHGLDFEYESGDAYVQPGYSRLRQLVIRSAKGLIGAVSLGRLSHKHTNLLYILRKPRT